MLRLLLPILFVAVFPILTHSLLHPKRFLDDLQARTILQNGQVRPTNYPNTEITSSSSFLANLTTFPPNASEIAYQGRWDADHVSWWSAPGLTFSFTASSTIAITFGPETSSGVLIAYRVDGLDWSFTNVTAGATHLLVSSNDDDDDYDYPISPQTFELRVTNWAYGVQIAAIHLDANASLVAAAGSRRRRVVEFIGDSLTAGMYTTYEGLSSFGYGIGAGLGGLDTTEYSVTAYPGICLVDQNCWGNPRGQVRQWFYTSDTSYRAQVKYGANAENAVPWDFAARPAADLVVINIGTNDQSYNVTNDAYQENLTKLIEGVHGVWPDAQVLIMSLWIGFYQYGNSFFDDTALGFPSAIRATADHFNSEAYLAHATVYDAVTNTTRTLSEPSKPFVRIFNTTGILQHNDIGPQYHPTDVGAIKVASHALQYIKLTYGWELDNHGPEVQHDTLYWNDEPGY